MEEVIKKNRSHKRKVERNSDMKGSKRRSSFIGCDVCSQHVHRLEYNSHWGNHFQEENKDFMICIPSFSGKFWEVAAHSAVRYMGDKKLYGSQFYRQVEVSVLTRDQLKNKQEDRLFYYS